MYDIFERLLEKFGITAYRFCKDNAVNASTISTWKKNNSLASPELSKKVCDYFGITLDYLMTGKEEPVKKETTLTPKDERDIAKDLNNIMSKLRRGEAGPAAYDGEELSPDAAELFAEELEIALKRLKLINKEKYTPKKFKK